MNYKTLSPTAKILKKQQIFTTGQTMTSGEVQNIGVIVACNMEHATKTIENIKSGIRAKGGAPTTFHMPHLGYINKVNPMTAKYAHSFMLQTSRNIEAIIKPNMLDGVVIVSDCDITITGALLGTLKINCPTLVITTGIYGKYLKHNNVYNLFEIATGTTGFESIDAAIEDSNSHDAGSMKTIISVLEKIGLSSDQYPNGSGAHHKCAYEIGEKIVEYAEKLILPKKLLTKDKYATAITETFNSMNATVDLSQIELINTLFDANDTRIKSIEHSGIIQIKGSASEDGGIMQITTDSPTHFTGSAWVYQSLEDADRALLGGSIKEGIIILQNCVNVNVSAIALIIEEMELTDKIAIATDGVCESTATLVIQKCTPNTQENESFANIQTGDALEINIAKGRFNTSILAKDIKTRAKRNSPKKPTVYFS